MVVPFGMLASIGVSAETSKTVYLSAEGTGTDTYTTMADAYNALGTNGGTIVIKGTYKQTAQFNAPAHTGLVTIKGENADSVLNITGGRTYLGGDTKIDSLKIDVDTGWALVGAYADITITESVVLDRAKATGTGLNDAFLVFGLTTTGAVGEFTVTVNGGDWFEIDGIGWKNTPTDADMANLQNVKVTFNYGGNATVNKIALYSRGLKTAFVAENGSCVVNLNGGKINNWIAQTDNYVSPIGYGKGVTYNISKDFDVAASFDAALSSLDANRYQTDQNGRIFHGINGDSAWAVPKDHVEVVPAIGKSKIILAAEVYDALKNSDKFRGATIEKAAEAETPASKIDLPAEPTLTSDTKVYIGYNGKGTKDGSNADNYKHTQGWSTGGSLHNSVANGGTFIVVGKGYFGATATFSATGTPVYITAKDGATDYTGTANNTADANGNGIPDGQGTQTGMFMIANRAIMTIAGEVIFNDITIIDRSKSDENASLGYNPYTTFNVTGKLVIGDNVDVIVSENDVEFSKYTPVITVAETGYVYLHSLGFSDYTGTGVIVIGDEILDDITEEMFANFDGKLVDEDGYEIDFDADDNQGGGSNPDTSDKTWALAVVAAIAVMGCAVVVASKKRA